MIFLADSSPLRYLVVFILYGWGYAIRDRSPCWGSMPDSTPVSAPRLSSLSRDERHTDSCGRRGCPQGGQVATTPSYRNWLRQPGLAAERQ